MNQFFGGQAVAGFARGGSVDSVPAMLTPGEFVIVLAFFGIFPAKTEPQSSLLHSCPSVIQMVFLQGHANELGANFWSHQQKMSQILSGQRYQQEDDYRSCP